MKISFITTVFNEADNIEKFINSILTQSVKPSEILVVDGGSTDGTIDIVKKISKKNKKVKLIVRKGANIAQGRNIGIKNSKGDIIFTGDASTRFEKDWIKKLLVGFKKGADFSVGTIALEKPQNLTEETIGTRVVDLANISNEKFKKYLPSNRNIAYKKSVHKKIGYAPENIDRSDDTVLHMRAKEKGLKYYLARNAKVYWHPRRNLKEVLKLAYEDSRSDARYGLFFKRKINILQHVLFTILILLLIINWKVFLLLFALSLLAFLYEGGRKAVKRKKRVSVVLYSGLMSFLLFKAHSIGGFVGSLQRVHL